jgi:hypothetical protein
MACLNEGGRLQANFSNRDSEHHADKFMAKSRFCFGWLLF